MTIIIFPTITVKYVKSQKHLLCVGVTQYTACDNYMIIYKLNIDIMVTLHTNTINKPSLVIS